MHTNLAVVGESVPDLLTPAALEFLVDLDRAFAGERVELLKRRCARRARIAAGEEALDFLDATAAIRSDESWRVAPAAPGLVDRRVEITGPPDRKMTVNALNSGARVWLADFEDALAPTWANVVGGQRNLRDAIHGRLCFTADNGKRYEVGGDPATIVVRPRGWHLVEKHLVIDGRPIPAALVDFGLYLFHCGQSQVDRGHGPYFYLPKLESHLEARLWNDVFERAQRLLGLAHGTIRATVLIETITAAFEMDEILYELRDHSAGLNAGRWDYIFSIIKTLGRYDPAFVLPDRDQVRMTAPFLRAYTDLLVATCHRRGAYAIGGMSAYIPTGDPDRNQHAFDQVRADKQREAGQGFDGSWVAHPGLVPICREVFDQPHQLDRRPAVCVTAAQLLDVASLPVVATEKGLRHNLAAALRYISSWLSGTGAVALNDLMEDAATAEIARSQIWQWLRFRTLLADGRPIDHALIDRLLDEEVIAADRDGYPMDAARAVFTDCALGAELPEFFTTRAYARHLVRRA
jgi:malate synthase